MQLFSNKIGIMFELMLHIKISNDEKNKENLEQSFYS